MSHVDPYIDPSSGILRNLLGLSSLEELSEFEAQIVFANEISILDSNIKRTNNLLEVCAIHKHLFSDIYDWAGEVRTVDIAKNDDDSDFFLISNKITNASTYIFGELAKDNHLKGLDQDRFVNRLAYFYDQLNYIHPFREGNGRTQRIFWSRVANDAGYVIDWAGVVGNENDEASRVAANTMDISLLVSMFGRVVSKR